MVQLRRGGNKGKEKKKKEKWKNGKNHKNHKIHKSGQLFTTSDFSGGFEIFKTNTRNTWNTKAEASTKEEQRHTLFTRDLPGLQQVSEVL